MYSLIVRHKDQNIIHRTLTSDELSTLDGSGVQLIVNAFREYIGLDILSYGLNEYDNTDKSFILYIRTEDLEELRNSKLNNLGI